MNVMTLAWKIMKSNKLSYTFSYALRLAWKIVKRAKVQIEEGLICFKSKLFSQFDFFTPTQRKRYCIAIQDNDSNTFSLFIEELKGAL